VYRPAVSLCPVRRGGPGQGEGGGKLSKVLSSLSTGLPTGAPRGRGKKPAHPSLKLGGKKGDRGTFILVIGMKSRGKQGLYFTLFLREEGKGGGGEKESGTFSFL